jgi:hypothetical protein
MLPHPGQQPKPIARSARVSWANTQPQYRSVTGALAGAQDCLGPIGHLSLAKMDERWLATAFGESSSLVAIVASGSASVSSRRISSRRR